MRGAVGRNKRNSSGKFVRFSRAKPRSGPKHKSTKKKTSPKHKKQSKKALYRTPAAKRSKRSSSSANRVRQIRDAKHKTRVASRATNVPRQTEPRQTSGATVQRPTVIVNDLASLAQQRNGSTPLQTPNGSSQARRVPDLNLGQMVPNGTSETVLPPNGAAETAANGAAETAPDGAAETVPDGAAETAADGTAETAPDGDVGRLPTWFESMRAQDLPQLATWSASSLAWEIDGLRITQHKPAGVCDGKMQCVTNSLASAIAQAPPGATFQLPLLDPETLIQLRETIPDLDVPLRYLSDMAEEKSRRPSALLDVVDQYVMLARDLNQKAICGSTPASGPEVGLRAFTAECADDVAFSDKTIHLVRPRMAAPLEARQALAVGFGIYSAAVQAAVRNMLRFESTTLVLTPLVPDSSLLAPLVQAARLAVKQHGECELQVRFVCPDAQTTADVEKQLGEPLVVPGPFATTCGGFSRSGNDWFADLFGVAETEAKKKVMMPLHKWPSRMFATGQFELMSLSAARVPPLAVGPKLFSIVFGDVSLHMANVQNERATFLVASRFHCLDLAGDFLTPVNKNRTQGAAASVATAPGTLARQRAVMDLGADFHILKGVNQKLQAAGLPAIAIAQGFSDSKQDMAVFAPDKKAVIDDCMRAMQVGVHWDTEVVTCSSGKVILTQPSQLVTLVLAATLVCPQENKKTFQTITTSVLTHAYKLTFQAAVMNMKRNYFAPASRVVFLTLLGGGVFHNESSWIMEALIEAYRECGDPALDVRVIFWSQKIKDDFLKELTPEQQSLWNIDT